VHLITCAHDYLRGYIAAVWVRTVAVVLVDSPEFVHQGMEVEPHSLVDILLVQLLVGTPQC